MMLSFSTILFLVSILSNGSTCAWGWQSSVKQHRLKKAASPDSTLLSRRCFLDATPAVVTLVSIASLTQPRPAYAATSTETAAKDQWTSAVDVIDNLLANWPKYTTGDSIRVELGTQGTTSPLFQIDKALKVLREDASDIVEFTEQAEEFQLTLARADSMAYSANFAGGSGKPTPPAVYIEKSKTEIISLQRIAKALSALL